jgi:hypothetical protein
MASGLYRQNGIGIMPSLHPKAYHSAFSAPEAMSASSAVLVLHCLLMPVRFVKQNDSFSRKNFVFTIC